MNPKDNTENWERKMKIIARSEVIKYDVFDNSVDFKFPYCCCCWEIKPTEYIVVVGNTKYPTCALCVKEANSKYKENK